MESMFIRFAALQVTYKMQRIYSIISRTCHLDVNIEIIWSTIYLSTLLWNWKGIFNSNKFLGVATTKSNGIFKWTLCSRQLNTVHNFRQQSPTFFFFRIWLVDKWATHITNNAQPVGLLAKTIRFQFYVRAEIRHWMKKNGLNIPKRIQFIEFSMLKVMVNIRGKILAKDPWRQPVHSGTHIYHASNPGRVCTQIHATSFRLYLLLLRKIIRR